MSDLTITREEDGSITLTGGIYVSHGSPGIRFNGTGHTFVSLNNPYIIRIPKWYWLIITLPVVLWAKLTKREFKDFNYP